VAEARQTLIGIAARALLECIAAGLRVMSPRYTATGFLAGDFFAAALS
jgi:hypothetical protein